MGFFSRLGNIISGFFSSLISGVEERHPEAVYESAINERLKKQKELKKAVSGIVFLRNKTEKELEEKEAELVEINAQLEVAVDEGEDEVALVLLERQGELEPRILELRNELENVRRQAEDAMGALNSFREEIKKLKREKEEMLAKAKTAEARIKIQESLDGLSLDADTQALENVRSGIHKRVAEADIGAELEDNSMDRKLAEIKRKTGNAQARSKLAKLKKMRAAKEGAAENVKKTI